jgi:hypothetical protein
MDEDLPNLTKDDLIAEVTRLREGIRHHRDSSGHDLCWPSSAAVVTVARAHPLDISPFLLGPSFCGVASSIAKRLTASYPLRSVQTPNSTKPKVGGRFVQSGTPNHH